MWFDGPAPQRRWSVALRLVLALPPLVVLLVLVVVQLPVAVVGWLGALSMGRLPRWAHTFIGGVARYETRFLAYVLLLTDRYPPISLDDSEYPARPFVPPNGPLNPWAVLLRFILVVPAIVFELIVVFGLVIPVFLVTWCIILFTGDMPPSLYAAYAALVRYLFRLRSYAFLLTPEYPWGMAGDQAASGAESVGEVPSDPPDRNRLVLAGPARRWLTFAIAWGSILFVGNLVVQSVLIASSVSATSQGNTVVNGFNQTKAAIDRAIRDQSRCSSSTTVACLSASHKAAAISLDRFESDLRSLAVPANARGSLGVVEREVRQLAVIFNRLANSANVDVYAVTFLTDDVNARLRSLPRDTNKLLSALNANVYY